MLQSHQFLVGLLCVCLVIYFVYQRCRRHSCDADEDDDDDSVLPEYFTPTSPADPTTPSPQVSAEVAPEPLTAVEFNLQEALDFSDVVVSDAQRQEYTEHIENTKQVETVDERFRAAKRKTEEHGMRPGMMTNKKRRELVEALVRRPFCGRRTRSWRTEFSDSLRGDVIPKQKVNHLGLMTIGRSDPQVDLHPGALGQVSGLNGRWVSTEMIPENLVDDFESP